MQYALVWSVCRNLNGVNSVNSVRNASSALMASPLRFSLQVTVFSTSEKKREEALKVLKADHFIVSKNEEQMKVRAVY